MAGAAKSARSAASATPNVAGSGGVEVGSSGSVGRARSNAVTSQKTTGTTKTVTPEQAQIQAQKDMYMAQAKGQAMGGVGSIVAGGFDRAKADEDAAAQELQTDQQTLQSHQGTVQQIAGDKKAPELINAMMTLVQQLHSVEQQIWS